MVLLDVLLHLWPCPLLRLCMPVSHKLLYFTIIIIIIVVVSTFFAVQIHGRNCNIMASIWEWEQQSHGCVLHPCFPVQVGSSLWRRKAGAAMGRSVIGKMPLYTSIMVLVRHNWMLVHRTYLKIIIVLEVSFTISNNYGNAWCKIFMCLRFEIDELEIYLVNYILPHIPISIIIFLFKKFVLRS